MGFPQRLLLSSETVKREVAGKCDKNVGKQRKSAQASRQLRYKGKLMNFLPVLAILLLIIWIVARVVLAVTGFFLHLLWVMAIVLFVIWLIRKILR